MELDAFKIRDLTAGDITDVESIWRKSGLVRDNEDAVSEIEMLLKMASGIAIGATTENGTLVGVVFGQDEGLVAGWAVWRSIQIFSAWVWDMFS